MKKIEGFFVILLATVALLFVWTQTAQAQSACTSSTYLHLDCATPLATGWVNYDCCSQAYRRSYNRHNANRIDIYVRAWHPGRNAWSCRWVITRGNDFSKYAYYHPDSYWHTC